MNEVPDSAKEWQPCQGGEIRNTVRRAQWKRFRRNLDHLAQIALLVLICVLAGGLVYRYRNSPAAPEPSGNYGGISCEQTQANLPQYMAGTLDPQLRQKVALHLEQCPICSRRFQEMQAGQPMVQWIPHRANCSCATCSQRLLADLHFDWTPMSNQATGQQ